MHKAAAVFPFIVETMDLSVNFACFLVCHIQSSVTVDLNCEIFVIQCCEAFYNTLDRFCMGLCVTNLICFVSQCRDVFKVCCYGINQNRNLGCITIRRNIFQQRVFTDFLNENRKFGTGII